MSASSLAVEVAKVVYLALGYCCMRSWGDSSIHDCTCSSMDYFDVENLTRNLLVHNSIGQKDFPFGSRHLNDFLYNDHKQH